jgi:hypothetical protein
LNLLTGAQGLVGGIVTFHLKFTNQGGSVRPFIVLHASDLAVLPPFATRYHGT